MKHLALLTLLVASTALAQEPVSYEIEETSMVWQHVDDKNYIFSIGRLVNTGSEPIKSPIIEIQFLDENGELVDVGAEYMYNTTLQPGESVAFRAQTYAVVVQGDYVSQELRLRLQRSKPPCDRDGENSGKQQRGVFAQLLISSFPILLLIGVWIWFIRKLGGKESPQERSMELAAEQNETLKRIADAVDRNDRG